MAPTLKLHTYPASKNAAKALIAAEYNGVKIDLPPFEFGVTNKTPAFLKLNPLGKARARALTQTAPPAWIAGPRRANEVSAVGTFSGRHGATLAAAPPSRVSPAA
jgi:hypothetical protein